MKTKAFYCVGTHWDREWYEPFQEFRMWLVELIDELLDLMARDPQYKSFHLDGQAVVLKDYLEIRPERREELLHLLREGRLFAGPWYVLPDEWLISSESYVRNIMLGMRTCRELGFEPLNFAYTPDQFGHIAALPMIMRNFDLQAGICWRGTQDENFPAQFIWIGPDGSRMPTHKLVDKGSYSPFGMLARGPMRDAGFTDESFATHFDPLFEVEQARAKVPLVLLLDAIDHQGPDATMPRLLTELTERYPDVEFIWGSLADYAREMCQHACDLPEYAGELREPCRSANRPGQYLIVHTISSRYPIKKRNDQCQAIMEKWAEPCALFQRMAGGTPILQYLDVAWDHLIKNHPHDSICGCSVDQVHRDMMYRFDQCELIADGVVRRALAHVGRANESDVALTNVVVHNPLPYAREGIFEIEFDFPKQWPHGFIDGLATAEYLNKFILVTKDGSRLPFQLSAIERGVVHRRLRENGRRTAAGGDVYHLAVEMALPPCGYTGFRIEPTEEATRNFGSLMTGPLTASNGQVEFTLHLDGTASLKCLHSKRAFDNLFLYEDCGDSGDGWTRGKLINDLVYRGPGSRVTTSVDEDGPLRTVFRVDRELDLPREVDRRSGWRSEDRVRLLVTDRIYVEKGAPYVRVRTQVKNNCKDHRLRVLFPSSVDSPFSFAETPFALVERPIMIPDETKAWQERVNPETAFSTFFGITDHEGGLAVLAPFGLHEYEVLQTPDRSLALTLFRATRQTVGTDGEPDGELLGDLSFEYLLYPFKSGFDAAEASRLVAGVQAGIRTHTAAELPEDRSFVALLKGETVCTAVKPSADGCGGVIRLWNPEPIVQEEVLHIACPVQSAGLCNLNEELRQPIALNANGDIPVSVPARGLATVRFTWA